MADDDLFRNINRLVEEEHQLQQSHGRVVEGYRQ